MSTAAHTGGEAVVETLAAAGVDTVFGIPGGHSLPIYAALHGHSQVRHVLGRHEQGGPQAIVGPGQLGLAGAFLCATRPWRY